MCFLVRFDFFISYVDLSSAATTAIAAAAVVVCATALRYDYECLCPTCFICRVYFSNVCLYEMHSLVIRFAFSVLFFCLPQTVCSIRLRCWKIVLAFEREASAVPTNFVLCIFCVAYFFFF